MLTHKTPAFLCQNISANAKWAPSISFFVVATHSCDLLFSNQQNSNQDCFSGLLCDVRESITYAFFSVFVPSEMRATNLGIVNDKPYRTKTSLLKCFSVANELFLSVGNMMYCTVAREACSKEWALALSFYRAETLFCNLKAIFSNTDSFITDKLAILWRPWFSLKSCSNRADHLGLSITPVTLMPIIYHASVSHINISVMLNERFDNSMAHLRAVVFSGRISEAAFLSKPAFSWKKPHHLMCLIKINEELSSAQFPRSYKQCSLWSILCKHIYITDMTQIHSKQL